MFGQRKYTVVKLTALGSLDKTGLFAEKLDIQRNRHLRLKRIGERFQLTCSHGEFAVAKTSFVSIRLNFVVYWELEVTAVFYGSWSLFKCVSHSFLDFPRFPFS